MDYGGCYDAWCDNKIYAGETQPSTAPSLLPSLPPPLPPPSSFLLTVELEGALQRDHGRDVAPILRVRQLLRGRVQVVHVGGVVFLREEEGGSESDA